MDVAANRELKRRIEIARTAIAEARSDLTGAIGEIEAGQRAEKRHGGEPLKTALDRLRVAQDHLVALEDLLAR
jgi:hypothetical protein